MHGGKDSGLAPRMVKEKCNIRLQALGFRTYETQKARQQGKRLLKT